MIKLIFVILFALNCWAARDFDGSTEFLEADTTAFSATPFTIAGWVFPDQVSSSAVMVQISDKDVTDHRFGCYINSSARAVFRAQAGGGNEFAVGAGTFSTGSWQHMACVSASATDRTVYRDGGNTGTNTVSVIPAGLDRTSIGRAGDSSPGEEFDGRLATIGIWSAALTASEILSLFNGASPFSIRPGALIHYYAIGGQSPERDLVGTVNLTVTGTPLQVEEPPFPDMIKAPGL